MENPFPSLTGCKTYGNVEPTELTVAGFWSVTDGNGDDEGVYVHYLYKCVIYLFLFLLFLLLLLSWLRIMKQAPKYIHSPQKIW